MPEIPAHYEGVNALEYVTYHAMFYGPNKALALEKATAVLESLGLGDQLDAPVDRMSYGNQKKVSLAVATVHDPDLLLLDEPTTGLDPGSVVIFRDMVKGFKKKGKTVFMSSHVLTEVEKVCDSCAIMVDGRLRHREEMASLVGRMGKDTGLEQVFLELTGQAKEGGKDG
jgi:ABC-2 type transport system ATP-binding protein